MEKITTHLIESGSRQRDLLEIEESKLVAIAGKDKGREFALGADSALIGTGADCDLVLRDETVSKRHAEISMTTNGYTIRDLKSKNGVTINDVPVQRAFLVDRAVIRLGNCVLSVQRLGTTSSVPLTATTQFGELVTHSIAMRSVAASIERVAPSEATVLIEGETGVGKEVVARTLHWASPRRDGPFVVVDCTSFHRDLMVSTLFGHERGAYTGADSPSPRPSPGGARGYSVSR